MAGRSRGAQAAYRDESRDQVEGTAEMTMPRPRKFRELEADCEPAARVFVGRKSRLFGSDAGLKDTELPHGVRCSVNLPVASLLPPIAVLNWFGKLLGRVSSASSTGATRDQLVRDAIGCQQASRFEDAERLLYRALALEPDSAEIHLLLGNLYRLSSKLDRALHCCLDAVRLAPNLPQAHNNLGMPTATSAIQSMRCRSIALLSRWTSDCPKSISISA
jgi:hypothetical protein